MIRLADVVKQSDSITQPPKRIVPGKDDNPSLSHGQGKLKISPTRVYESCKNYLEMAGENLKEEKEIDVAKGRRYIRAIIKNSELLLEEMHFLTLLSAGNDQGSLSAHAVNVMVSALIIGKELGYSPGELEKLGMAAMFHETGMYLIPEYIREKKGKFTEEELAMMKQHPEIAYNELRKYGPEYQGIAEVILQEHERIDGSGYPFGLEGAQVHEHASIIGLLDIYVALINSRPYREKMDPSEAMKIIVRRTKSLFPVPIIKKLLVQLSIYPVKSYVRLNNASIGIVMKINTLWPLKPVIMIVFDAQGKKIESLRKVIDLSKSPLLYIKNVILADDVEAL